VGTINEAARFEFYFGLKGKAKQKRIQELLDEIETGDVCRTATGRAFGRAKNNVSAIAPWLAAKPKPDICERGHKRLDPLVAERILKAALIPAKDRGCAYLVHPIDLVTVKGHR